jgi:hypothetical protein
MIQIIEDNVGFKNQLEQMITKDGTYIDLNVINTSSDKRTDRLGLNYAISELKANPDQTIVLYSFEQAQGLFLDNDFMKIMATSNSYFIRLPFMKEHLDLEMNTPKFHNAALEIAGSIGYNSSLRSRLLHDHGYRPNEVIATAKKEFGFTGSDLEIVQQLISYDANAVKAKGPLPGVFVDVEGTLLKDDKINLPVVAMMIAYSRTKPVSIWTGGDRKEMTKKIGLQLEIACGGFASDNPIYNRIPVLNKQTFEGYEPEIVLDDLSQEKFEQDYRMKPKQYVKI